MATETQSTRSKLVFCLVFVFNSQQLKCYRDYVTVGCSQFSSQNVILSRVQTNIFMTQSGLKCKPRSSYTVTSVAFQEKLEWFNCLLPLQQNMLPLVGCPVQGIIVQGCFCPGGLLSGGTFCRGDFCPGAYARSPHVQCVYEPSRLSVPSIVA